MGTRWSRLARRFATATAGIALALLVSAPAASASGASLVRDINPGASSSDPGAQAGWQAAAGGRLYFSAGDGVHGTELWRSDGTAAGTTEVLSAVALDLARMQPSAKLDAGSRPP